MSDSCELEVVLPEIEIPDLNLPSALDIRDGIIDLEGVPDTAATILGLRAIGYGYKKISTILDCSRSTVAGYCRRYDPDGLCRISEKDKRKITSQMLTSTSMAALMEITTDKLRTSSAKELSGIAARCASAAEKLRLGDIFEDEDKSARIDSMMNLLEAEVEVIE